MTRFRCAVLSVVKHAYVPRAVGAHPRFELTVVADDPDQPEWAHVRNQRFADECGIPYVRDVERALRDYNVQVAVVSPAAERHVNLSLRAVRAGLHVVQDKPLSNRLAECDRLVAAVEERGVRFLLWNRNFLPAVQQAYNLVATEEIGSLLAIHADFYFAKDAGPPAGSRRAGDPPINWLEYQISAHRDGSDGGLGREPMGELQIEGIYPLAYIRFLTGLEVRRVFARTATFFHQVNADNQVEDLATLSLEMEHGVVGSLALGRIGAASHPDIGEIKLHLLGTDGALVVSEARPEVALYYRDQPPQEFRHRRVDNDNDYWLMEDFARAIDTGGATVLDAHGGRAICAVVEAALQSARDGQPVTL
ncbi:MAG: Gfo/Idh/MocA family protein [Planctomycetales bacterium]